MTKLTRTTTAVLAAAGLSACAAVAEPWPTPEPNAPGQTPAFPEQTRAPAMDSGISLNAQTLVEGLVHPWAVAILPDGGALVTERPGRMRLYRDGALSEPLSGLPRVDARGQGGLLDVSIARDFETSRTLFFSYAAPADGGNTTAVSRATLSQDGTALENVTEIFRVNTVYDGDKHFGSRILPADDGTLFITLGERSDAPIRERAQDPQSHLGKLIRINADGSVPGDNPHADGGSALPEIYASGFRNVQAAAFDPQGRIWTIEHGPRGGDELNRPQPGLNYGWPVITYGVEYSGDAVGEGNTAREGLEQPVYYWDPVIAPSGAVFYEGEAFGPWQGDLVIGAMRPPALVRLRLENDRVAGEERFDPGIGRIRDVEIASDGALWVVTDEERGGLYRLTPES